MIFSQISQDFEDAIAGMTDGFIGDVIDGLLPDINFSPGDYIDLPTAILMMATLATFMVIVVIAMPYVKQFQMK